MASSQLIYLLSVLYIRGILLFTRCLSLKMKDGMDTAMLRWGRGFRRTGAIFVRQHNRMIYSPVIGPFLREGHTTISLTKAPVKKAIGAGIKRVERKRLPVTYFKSFTRQGSVHLLYLF